LNRLFKPRRRVRESRKARELGSEVDDAGIKVNLK